MRDRIITIVVSMLVFSFTMRLGDFLLNNKDSSYTTGAIMGFLFGMLNIINFDYWMKKENNNKKNRL